MADEVTLKSGCHQYCVRHVSCCVRLDYRRTVFVSRNCQRHDVPIPGAQRSPLQSLHVIVKGSLVESNITHQSENTYVCAVPRLDRF